MHAELFGNALSDNGAFGIGEGGGARKHFDIGFKGAVVFKNIAVNGAYCGSGAVLFSRSQRNSLFFNKGLAAGIFFNFVRQFFKVPDSAFGIR